MITAGIALSIFALALFVPGVVSIVKRHRARKRLRAIHLAYALAENKSLHDDLDSADALLNAYRTANGVLYSFIRARHGDEVAASLPNPDAEPLWFAVEPELAWLDESTGWSS